MRTREAGCQEALDETFDVGEDTATPSSKTTSVRCPSPYRDVNTITTTLTFTAPVQKELSGNKTWVDPVAGVNVAHPLGDKGKVMLLANLGGFGAGSTIAADVFPTLQYRIATHAWLAVGYRYIYTNDNDDAGFVYKMANQGPAFGAVLPF